MAGAGRRDPLRRRPEGKQRVPIGFVTLKTVDLNAMKWVRAFEDASKYPDIDQLGIALAAWPRPDTAMP